MYSYLRDRNRNLPKTIKNIYLLLVIWHILLTATMVLRFPAAWFWPGMAIVGGLMCLFQREVDVRRYDVLIHISYVAILLSCAYSVNQSKSLTYMLQITIFVVVAYAFTGLTDRFEFVATAYIVIALFLTLATFQEAFLPDFYFNTLFKLLPSANQQQVYFLYQDSAYAGITGQTSTNALFLSIGAFFCIYKIRIRPEKHIAYYAALISMLLAVLLTQRRASFFILLLIVIYMLSSKKHLFRNIMILGFLILLLLIFGVDWIPGMTSLLGKFEAKSIGDSIIGARGRLWKIATDLFWEKPLIGYGICTYSSLVPGASSAHNAYLQVLCEMGLIGSIAFFAPYVYCFFRSMAAMNHFNKIKPDHPALPIIACCIGMQIFIFLGAVFESYFLEETYLLLLQIIQLQTLRAVGIIIAEGNREV